jgi:hypothetical protein
MSYKPPFVATLYGCLAGSYIINVPLHDVSWDTIKCETDGVEGGLHQLTPSGSYKNPFKYEELIGDNTSIDLYFEEAPTWVKINGITFAVEIVDRSEAVNPSLYEYNEADELAYLKESFELRHPDEDDVAEDWGYMGVETSGMNIASFVQSGARKTSWIKSDYFGDVVELQDVEMVDESQLIFLYSDNRLVSTTKSTLPTVMTINNPTYNIAFGSYDANISSLTINGVKYYLGDTCNKDEVKDPYESTTFNTSYGLKALIDWVDNCTDEEFVRDFEQHFHKDYTLRYFCLVTLVGAVDNLG